MKENVVKRLTNKEIFFYNWGSISLNFVEGVLFTWIMYFYAPPSDSGRTGLCADPGGRTDPNGRKGF